MTLLKRLCSFFLQNIVELERGKRVFSSRVLRTRLVVIWLLPSLFYFSALALVHLNPGDLPSIVLLFLSALVLGGIIYGFFRRWVLHYRAAHYFHQLTHKARDRIPAALKEEKAQDLRLMVYWTINSIARLFRSLAPRGSVSVMLLVPSSEQEQEGGIDNKSTATHLGVGYFSMPYDKISHARWETADQGPPPLLSIEASIAGSVYRNRTSILVRSSRLWVDQRPRGVRKASLRMQSGGRTFSWRSLICVPVSVAGDPLFVLSIDCSKARAFHSEYIDIARMCADLLALVFALAGVTGESKADDTMFREFVPGSTPLSVHEKQVLEGLSREREPQSRLMSFVNESLAHPVVSGLVVAAVLAGLTALASSVQQMSWIQKTQTYSHRILVDDFVQPIQMSHKWELLDPPVAVLQNGGTLLVNSGGVRSSESFRANLRPVRILFGALFSDAGQRLGLCSGFTRSSCDNGTQIYFESREDGVVVAVAIVKGRKVFEDSWDVKWERPHHFAIEWTSGEVIFTIDKRTRGSTNGDYTETMFAMVLNPEPTPMLVDSVDVALKSRVWWSAITAAVSRATGAIGW